MIRRCYTTGSAHFFSKYENQMKHHTVLVVWHLFYLGYIVIYNKTHHIKSRFKDRRSLSLNLHTLLENLYHKLHNQGISTTKNQALVISLHEEGQLWASETLSSGTPQGLINCVFFTIMALTFVQEGERNTGT